MWDVKLMSNKKVSDNNSNHERLFVAQQLLCGCFRGNRILMKMEFDTRQKFYIVILPCFPVFTLNNKYFDDFSINFLNSEP